MTKLLPIAMSALLLAGANIVEAQSSNATMPITNPQGRTVKYSVGSNDITLLLWGVNVDIADKGMAAEMVYDNENNVVYIKSPVTSLYDYDTYIKGSIDGNKITVTLPQPLIYFEDDGAIYYVNRLTYDEAHSEPEKPEYIIDDSEPLTYTIHDDGSITSDWTGTDVIMGPSIEDEWVYRGSYNITYTPFNQTILTAKDMPADFADKLQSNWLLASSKTSNRSVKVAEYNNKIYVEGVSPYNTEALIVGDINGDTVTFASNQYVGRNSINNYLIFFYGLTEADSYEDYDRAYNLADGVTFKYNASEGTLTEANRPFGLVGGDITKSDIYAQEDHRDATIKRIPDVVSLVPKDPYNLKYVPDDDDEPDYGGLLSFRLASVNIDGWPINEDNMYYRMYDNGTLFTFTPDVYLYDITENTTEIGWAQGNYYFSFWNDDEIHYIYIYYAPTNLGIQAVYKDGDTEYVSNIVYCNPIDNSGVSDKALGKTIVAETFTDLAGRHVANPQNGLYLKTVSYSDGTAKTVKVVVK
jgi:hypothetical protein